MKIPYYSEIQKVNVLPEWLTSAENFSAFVAPTTDYTDTKQSNLSLVQHQHRISKIAEEAVKQTFENLGAIVIGPDYKIYETREKSWSCDLSVNSIPIAVKAQDEKAALKFGLSWTFQRSSIKQNSGRVSRRDIFLDNPIALVCFVKYDEKENSCYVSLPYQRSSLEFREPVLSKLKDAKAVIYAKTLNFPKNLLGRSEFELPPIIQFP